MHLLHGRASLQTERHTLDETPIDIVAGILREESLARASDEATGSIAIPDIRNLAGSTALNGVISLEMPVANVDDNAIDFLYEQRYGHLYRTALLLVGPEAVEEVVTDGIAAMAGLNTSDRSLLGFAHRSLIIRSRLEALPVPDLEDKPKDIIDALRWLSPPQREVIVLRHYTELTDAEIIDATGLSLDDINDHDAKAKDFLQQFRE